MPTARTAGPAALSSPLERGARDAHAPLAAHRRRGCHARLHARRPRGVGDLMAELDTAFADVVARLRAQLALAGLTVIDQDLERPWGGFLVLCAGEVDRFVAEFFAEAELLANAERLTLSPKILIVAPRRRLSWQRHDRRSEIWRVIEGPVGVVRSPAGPDDDPERFEPGDILRLALGTPHRLVGLDGFGIVAEIWQHTDPTHPSDEQDIVRIADDHGR
jgi:mannose-6-phosphate isomerase